MKLLAAGFCPFERDAALSEARGLADRPHVYRCPRCGFITAPCRTDDPLRVRRKCRWFDPKVPGFLLADECWCHGLGDVIEKVFAFVTRPLPYREAILLRAGSLLDRYEAWRNLRDEKTIVKKSGGCGGCTRRKLSLNARFPLRWLRKRICPPIVMRREEAEPIPVCFVFPHGFGDAVQFTAVLRHLAKHRPNWRPSLYCKAGAHSLFTGKIDRVGIMDRDNMGKVYREDYALVHHVRWTEPESTYDDSPATKVERCLREEFGIEPEPELWGYHVNEQRDDELRALSALREIAEPMGNGRFNVVAIHYQGNSYRSSKNLDENIIRELVPVIRRAGFVPLILDFEPEPRSSLLREKVRGVRHFPITHPLWKGLGVGDGSAMYSLLRRVSLVFGIDSGPEHLAAATDTPTIVTWGRLTHPVNYFSPASNLLHVVRKDQAKYILGDWKRGQDFFERHYRSHVLKTNARIAALDLVETELANATHNAGRSLGS